MLFLKKGVHWNESSKCWLKSHRQYFQDKLKDHFKDAHTYYLLLMELWFGRPLGMCSKFNFANRFKCSSHTLKCYNQDLKIVSKITPHPLRRCALEWAIMWKEHRTVKTCSTLGRGWSMLWTLIPVKPALGPISLFQSSIMQKASVRIKQRRDNEVFFKKTRCKMWQADRWSGFLNLYISTDA